MVGMYSIDGKDLYTEFGTIVSSGSDTLLAFPARKTPFTKNWEDEHGIDVDLSNPKFEAKQIRLECAIIAANESDFWNKYRALFTLLSKPGKLRLFCNELGRSFYVYYTDNPNNKRFTRIKNSTKVMCKYTLNFTEPDPSFFEQYTFLTDKDGNYILTTNGNKIIV